MDGVDSDQGIIWRAIEELFAASKSAGDDADAAPTRKVLSRRLL
jgi:hypothetical protein